MLDTMEWWICSRNVSCNLFIKYFYLLVRCFCRKFIYESFWCMRFIIILKFSFICLRYTSIVLLERWYNIQWTFFTTILKIIKLWFFLRGPYFRIVCFLKLATVPVSTLPHVLHLAFTPFADVVGCSVKFIQMLSFFLPAILLHNTIKYYKLKKYRIKTVSNTNCKNKIIAIAIS